MLNVFKPSIFPILLKNKTALKHNIKLKFLSKCQCKGNKKR